MSSSERQPRKFAFGRKQVKLHHATPIKLVGLRQGSNTHNFSSFTPCATCFLLQPVVPWKARDTSKQRSCMKRRTSVTLSYDWFNLQCWMVTMPKSEISSREIVHFRNGMSAPAFLFRVICCSSSGCYVVVLGCGASMPAMCVSQLFSIKVMVINLCKWKIIFRHSTGTVTIWCYFGAALCCYCISVVASIIFVIQSHRYLSRLTLVFPPLPHNSQILQVLRY